MSRHHFNHRPSYRYRMPALSIAPVQRNIDTLELAQSQPAPPLVGFVEQRCIVVGESHSSSLHVIWTELNADPVTG